MSDSGDDLSSAADIPADAEIEQCLRTVVREATEKGEDVSVKSARTSAEEKLGLEAGFLKDNAQWKDKSKAIIQAAFEEPASPELPKKKAPPAKAKPAAKAGTKRKSDEKQPVRKKQKKSTVSDSDADDSDELSDKSKDDKEEVSERDTKSKSKATTKSEDESTLSDPPENDEPEKDKNGHILPDDDESHLSSVIDEPAPKKKRQKKAPAASKSTKSKKTAEKAEPPAKNSDDDSSDLSSVLDDPAPAKKGRKKKSTSPSTTTKSKPTTTKDLSPDEEEIKRLQSWLLKCGIRKLWHRELAPFDTNKEKIRHLKGMLEEVGMTGRFSAEKAKGIKERRELAAELEAVGEFNRTWGKEKGKKGDEGSEDGSDDEGGEGKGSGEEDGKEDKPVQAGGGRARPKGFVDFGDSDEESE